MIMRPQTICPLFTPDRVTKTMPTAVMTKILLAEDHPLLRHGLKYLLSQEDDLDIIAETGDGAAVEALIGAHQPDLLLLDLELPGRNGIDIARSVKATFEAVKILILTGDGRPESVRRALAAGADGYLLKADEHSAILPAVRDVLAGRAYISKGIAAGFERARSLSAAAAAAAAGAPAVTVREHEVLQLIAEGLPNQDVADRLFISVDTVRTHRRNVMEKLDLHNAAEITAYVMQSKFASRA